MDRFLPHDDDLGRLINAGSKDLFARLKSVDADSIGMPEHCLAYFKSSHSTRLFFSIETSAHILYRSVKLTGKKVDHITLMDYGAGVGTLYLLAKMIGCKQVIYNDHLDDWRISAELVAKAIGVQIDRYVVGDIGACLDTLVETGIFCDIIASRNVIEHIYKLRDFYNTIHLKHPGSIVFSSTTANKKNPAVMIKHVRWHKKWEKDFRARRMAIISKTCPAMSEADKKKLAFASRGLAVDDLTKAIERFSQFRELPDPEIYGTNTCDPANGVWAENLLSLQTHREQINENNFKVSFAAGFWDTHYESKLMNTLGATLNRIIAKGRGSGLRLAPFMYVIAVPKKAHE